MSNLSKKILEEIKNMSGNILCIGVSEQKYIDAIEKNEKITICQMMNLNITNTSRKRHIFGNKTINIKKIKKKFGKKKIDYVLCNVKDINRYLNTFVKDSIYICKSKVFFYSDNFDFNPMLLRQKYERYNIGIDFSGDEKKYLFEFDVSNVKPNVLKNLYYTIVDTFYTIIDFITDILVN